MSLSATDAEWAAVSGNAERRGLSKARYLMGLVEHDISGEDPAPPMVLAPDDQRALLASVRAIHALLTEGPAREESPPAEETAPPPPEGAPPPPETAPAPDPAEPSGPPPRQGRLL